ncbi:DUF4446 family protein [Anaeromicropila populeti]|uniref:DUF4446 domain-containing protein n=1 Tax=Anaeromicropila populeti TaxID=37658 RepID=A0A1I6LML4_9FIRM|nr:DUF4446 family protein [Anaeromicropila populeti]SFS04649.1 Protein of unknown function [Anaeromicropila populeti]
MNIFNRLGLDLEYVTIGLTGIMILLIILVLALFIGFYKQKHRLSKFMLGSDASSLEEIIKNKISDVEKIKLDIDSINGKISNIDDILLSTYRKIGIVKYDAFKEMGGKLSFALALLNDRNDGFILNSMHSSREGCFTYVKQIINGEAFVVLAEEEKQALNEAINSTNYME